MTRLVLLRHGQSEWNLENRFTGWTDVDLSPAGREEAREAGRLLAAAGFEVDFAFASVLRRAIRTLWIVQDEMDRMWIPVHLSWRLNERHYGALQGLEKGATALRYGDEQVRAWRRGYALRPPELERGDPRHPRHDPRYRRLPQEALPAAESLAETVARMLPFWHASIAPAVLAGRRVLIVAHGNSLRALVKQLEGLSDEEIVQVEIPTGRPLVYELDESLRPLRRSYLGGGSSVRPTTALALRPGLAPVMPGLAVGSVGEAHREITTGL